MDWEFWKKKLCLENTTLSSRFPFIRNRGEKKKSFTVDQFPIESSPLGKSWGFSRSREIKKRFHSNLSTVEEEWPLFFRNAKTVFLVLNHSNCVLKIQSIKWLLFRFNRKTKPRCFLLMFKAKCFQKISANQMQWLQMDQTKKRKKRKGLLKNLVLSN